MYKEDVKTEGSQANQKESQIICSALYIAPLKEILNFSYLLLNTEYLF